MDDGYTCVQQLFLGCLDVFQLDLYLPLYVIRLVGWLKY